MEESEYMAMANTIPDDWYTSQEARETAAGIFYDIMISTAMRVEMVIKDDNDLQRLLEIIASERNIPVTEVKQNIQNVALTVGAVRLFREKYPAIAEKFPRDAYDNPVYPPKFLAKVLGIDDIVAEDIINGVLVEYGVYLKPAELEH
ncbi:hypothetical protein KKI24_03360 [bacterium]|nr:hypothetical protein [bacterium]